ncbi:MAG: hypothetical protein Q8M71_01270 [Thermodesulfovibrionales bacterium]|nr:hypothetical protein [Thermodesulfovibrionales bacterium]
MKCTSLSDMRSKGRYQVSVIRCQYKASKILLFFILLFTVHCSLFTVHCSAEVIDRVVAFVDDRAITMSELENNYKDTVKLMPDIKREEVLNTVINRILLLREAKKLRIEAPAKDAIIQEYIELKLKTIIKITEEDLKEFYEKNRSEFGNVEFDDVRDKIENYLIEKEVNQRLEKHIEELRSKAYIKIQLEK